MSYGTTAGLGQLRGVQVPCSQSLKVRQWVMTSQEGHPTTQVLSPHSSLPPFFISVTENGNKHPEGVGK